VSIVSQNSVATNNVSVFEVDVNEGGPLHDSFNYTWNFGDGTIATVHNRNNV